MKNLFIFLFSFKGIVNRKQFLIIFPIFFVLLFSIAWITSTTKYIGYFSNIAEFVDFVLIPLAITCLASIFSFCWRRLEDLGRGKFWLLLLITPGWFLVLLLLSIFPSETSKDWTYKQIPISITVPLLDFFACPSSSLRNTELSLLSVWVSNDTSLRTKVKSLPFNCLISRSNSLLIFHW